MCIRDRFKACTNGVSELMSNISMSIVGMLYNMQLIKYAGENGVAAYGVLMYVNFIFLAAFIGYSVGTAPIIGYNYGCLLYTSVFALRRAIIFAHRLTGYFFIELFYTFELLSKGFHGGDF